MRFLAFVLACCGLLSLAGCGGKPEPRPVTPPPVQKEPAEKPIERGFTPMAESAERTLSRRLDLAAQGLASWRDLEPALLESLAWLESRPACDLAGHATGPSPARVTWGDVAMTVRELLHLLPRLDDEPELLAERFAWVRFRPIPRMTGYFIPALDASLTRDEDHPYPLYAVPPDLYRLDLGDFHPRWKGQRLVYRIEDGKAVPYFDRESIDFEGALDGKGVELAWAADLGAVNELQTQGSGVLVLPDGTRRRVGYAGKNGRQFRGVGGIIRDDGVLNGAPLTRENIRGYLRDDPEGARGVLAKNPSYVFFRFLDGPVVGAMGRPVTGRVTMAVDPAWLPLGSILVFDTALPSAEPGCPAEQTVGLGLAQDVGGAIKEGRIDYFWGEGDEAAYRAMRTNTPVDIYLLLPKERETE